MCLSLLIVCYVYYYTSFINNTEVSHCIRTRELFNYIISVNFFFFFQFLRKSFIIEMYLYEQNAAGVRIQFGIVNSWEKKALG